MAKSGAEALTREGAGNWRTKDGRFLIRGEGGGHWYLVDEARTDPFGLGLVTGPFATIDAAKQAIAEARASLAEQPAPEPTTTTAEGEAVPVPARPKRTRPGPASKPASEPAPSEPSRSKQAAEPAGTRPSRGARSGAAPDVPATKSGRPTRGPAEPKPPSEVAHPAEPAEPKPPAEVAHPAGPAEPPWLERLPAPDRRRARRAIAELERLGVDGATDVVRRDVAADTPEIARALLGARLSGIADEASDPDAARALLARALRLLTVTGRDPGAAEDLPGWRLVEVEDGRPGRRIILDEADVAGATAASKRRHGS